MATEVKVPVLPESVSDATIAAWHKKVGDAVKRDENLMDLETDKVVLEVPSPVDGVLKEIKFKEGDTVTSQQLLAIIEEGAVAAAPAPAVAMQAGGVQLQVASFASPDNAARALAMLRDAGVPGARLQDATVGGKRIWRLRVGPLAESAVSPLASRIAGLGFGPPAVVRE